MPVTMPNLAQAFLASGALIPLSSCTIYLGLILFFYRIITGV